MEKLKNRHILTGAVLAIAAVLFLIVNVTSGTIFKSLRLDLTQNKLYTLSSGSKEIVRGLNEPVILRLYFSKSMPNINPYLLSFAMRVEDLLVQYQRASKGKVLLEIIDPEPFSSQEDAAVNAGLQGIPVDNTGTDFYLGLVGTDSLNNKQIIPFLQPNRETSLEYDISQLIYKLGNPQPRIVGVMSSLPLQGGMNMRPWAVWQQMQQLFELKEVDYDATEIPLNVNTLMIVEPSTFTQDALHAIDKFVLRGGHVLAFVDPVSEVADAQTARNNTSRQNNAGNYKELLHAWGVNFDDDAVVTDRGNAKSVRLNNGGREITVRYPLWMDLTAPNFNKEDVLSSSLERLTFATPGYLTQVEGSAGSFTPLVSTSVDSMLIPAQKVAEYQQNLAALVNNYKPTGSYTLAARVSGPVKSAFGDETVPDANIIVVADADLLHDHFWLTIQDHNGQQIGTPNANNGNFVLSALDNLTGSNALIAIRNRGSFARPFETVRDLELQSQDKFRTTEQALLQKLELTKQKLEQLERQRTEGNSVLLDVRQRQEQDAFREELVQTRRELRDVRRQLNQEIEGLAIKIKFYSIGLIPLVIVLLGGLLYFRPLILRGRFHAQH